MTVQKMTYKAIKVWYETFLESQDTRSLNRLSMHDFESVAAPAKWAG